MPIRRLLGSWKLPVDLHFRDSGWMWFKLSMPSRLLNDSKRDHASVQRFGCAGKPCLLPTPGAFGTAIWENVTRCPGTVPLGPIQTYCPFAWSTCLSFGACRAVSIARERANTRLSSPVDPGSQSLFTDLSFLSSGGTSGENYHPFVQVSAVQWMCWLPSLCGQLSSADGSSPVLAGSA